MAHRRRLDAELVRRDLAASRTQAQAIIQSGRVQVAGTIADKAARLVAPGEAIVVVGEAARFVSRAGAKLDAALDRFALDVTGMAVLDAGASTGGFTDCLLQRGAAEVVAVDVGYGQLHERVAGDPRVRVLDRTNVRSLVPAEVGAPFDLVTADLSFISLQLVAPVLVGLLREPGSLVALVKPQFEAGREAVTPGRGVVRDPAVWTRVLAEVTSAFEELGATIIGVMASPITGTEGNVEFLVHARRPAFGSAPASGSSRQALVDVAVAEAIAAHGAPSVGRTG